MLFRSLALDIRCPPPPTITTTATRSKFTLPAQQGVHLPLDAHSRIRAHVRGVRLRRPLQLSYLLLQQRCLLPRRVNDGLRLRLHLQRQVGDERGAAVEFVRVALGLLCCASPIV